MTFICNLSLMTGIFPSELATAIITCIFKSGNIDSFENDRSISILNAFRKILEKIITVHLVKYFVVNNFFTECQFGYRQGVSTIDAVLRIVNFIYYSFDERKIVIGVFLDLSKVFDTLNQSILLNKLKHYGVRDKELSWFKSYFKDKKQRVKYKGFQSDVLNNGIGVAQGSILGPVMYIIYMNDIVKCSNVLNFTLYADDTCVCISDENLNKGIETMNKELIFIHKWLHSNCLTLNTKKSLYVVLERNRAITNTNNKVCINNVELDKSSNTKYLGIYIDENLNWSEHINYVIRKTSKLVPILYQVRNNMSRNSLKLLNNSIIYPSFIYGNIIWGSSSKSKLNPLIVLQTRLLEF